MPGGGSAEDKAQELRDAASMTRQFKKAGLTIPRGQSESALKRQADKWEAGAAGERVSEGVLDRLRPYGFTTLHDVLVQPGKLWNLDHVTLSTRGAVFVDAKVWKGNLTVHKDQLWRHYTGRKAGSKRVSQNMTSEVEKAAFLAERASSRLGMRVTPLLCMTGSQARQFTDIVTVGGVMVMSVDRVGQWLRDQPVIMSTGDAAAWVGHARKVFPPASGPSSSAAESAAAWEEAMRPIVKIAPAVVATSKNTVANRVNDEVDQNITLPRRGFWARLFNH